LAFDNPTLESKERNDMSGFGIARIKQEGAPIHPDDIEGELSDARYYTQLVKYYIFHKGIPKDESVVRSELLDRLRKEWERAL
jgi:hypothetical protein